MSPAQRTRAPLARAPARQPDPVAARLAARGLTETAVLVARHSRRDVALNVDGPRVHELRLRPPRDGLHRASTPSGVRCSRHREERRARPSRTSSSAPPTAGSTGRIRAPPSGTSTPPVRRTCRAASRSWSTRASRRSWWGGDTAASPAEYLLHALAACMTSAIVYVAAARGIQLTEVECRAEGDLDVRGMFAISRTSAAAASS